MMDKESWGKALGDALQRSRKEREEQKKRLDELERHRENMDRHGAWDAWGGRLSSYLGPRGLWLRDNDLGIFICNVNDYRHWRVNNGFGWGRTEAIGIEWSYLIGGGAPKWEKTVWSIEDSDEMLLWDMRTGKWLS